MAVLRSNRPYLVMKSGRTKLSLHRTRAIYGRAVAIEPKSPPAVCAKREYLRIRLETFGRLVLESEKRECGDRSRIKKAPAFAAFRVFLGCPVRPLDCLAGDAVLVAPVSKQIP